MDIASRYAANVTRVDPYLLDEGLLVWLQYLLDNYKQIAAHRVCDHIEYSLINIKSFSVSTCKGVTDSFKHWGYLAYIGLYLAYIDVHVQVDGANCRSHISLSGRERDAVNKFSESSESDLQCMCQKFISKKLNYSKSAIWY